MTCWSSSGSTHRRASIVSFRSTPSRRSLSAQRNPLSPIQALFTHLYPHGAVRLTQCAQRRLFQSVGQSWSAQLPPLGNQAIDRSLSHGRSNASSEMRSLSWRCARVCELKKLYVYVRMHERCADMHTSRPHAPCRVCTCMQVGKRTCKYSLPNRYKQSVLHTFFFALTDT